MEPFNSASSLLNSIIILSSNKVQTYAWGCTDKNCFVGQMSPQMHPTYAEFWMGTHPNGQSKINSQLSLKQYLSSKGIPEIEFLFKILSIQKCLSIQAHPNEQEAIQLHQKFPQIYDAKDKPEMLLTLSDKFELFLGFIDEQDFSELIIIQPFSSLVSQINKTSLKEKLIELLEKLVHLDQIQLKKNINALKQNIGKFDKNRQKIILRIIEEFGFDTGILVSCLLKYHILGKDQCFGIQAGVPHAYIKGECFQLMKNSDNVIRLGLTPKKKDIPNLMSIIKKNIHNNYCKIQKHQDSSVEKFEWNSYSILRIKLSSEPNKIQIFSSSIGLAFYGDAQIISNENEIKSVRITHKTVFFIQKGFYFFKGHGLIMIASKN